MTKAQGRGVKSEGCDGVRAQGVDDEGGRSEALMGRESEVPTT